MAEVTRENTKEYMRLLSAEHYRGTIIVAFHALVDSILCRRGYRDKQGVSFLILPIRVTRRAIVLDRNS